MVMNHNGGVNSMKGHDVSCKYGHEVTSRNVTGGKHHDHSEYYKYE